MGFLYVLCSGRAFNCKVVYKYLYVLLIHICSLKRMFKLSFIINTSLALHACYATFPCLVSDQLHRQCERLERQMTRTSPGNLCNGTEINLI